MADRGKAALATTLALVLLAASWLPLGFSTQSLVALLVGVLVLDLAAQLLHVSNQNVVFALRPEARNRLNAGYMTGYFIGGSLGSLVSAQVYGAFGWTGVCVTGAGVAAVLETARLLAQPQYRPRRSVLFVLFSGSEQLYLGSRIFLANFPQLRKVEAFINVQNIGCGDSIVLLGDNRYPSLWEIARVRDSANHSLIHRSPEATNPRGDARGFDAIGIPSLVFTSLNGLQHNHVPSDIWENIDRRMLTGASQVMVETVRELCDGMYRGRSPKSKALKFME
jgi:MFS family permease